MNHHQSHRFFSRQPLRTAQLIDNRTPQLGRKDQIIHTMALRLPLLPLTFVLITILLFPRTTDSYLVLCPPAFGYLRPNSTRCQRCPPGTYSITDWHEPFQTRRMTCSVCQPNTYTPVWSGVASESLCTPCPPGTASRPGSSKCKRCPNGTSAMPSGRCMRCPPGTSKRRDTVPHPA